MLQLTAKNILPLPYPTKARSSVLIPKRRKQTVPAIPESIFLIIYYFSFCAIALELATQVAKRGMNKLILIFGLNKFNKSCQILFEKKKKDNDDNDKKSTSTCTL